MHFDAHGEWSATLIPAPRVACKHESKASINAGLTAVIEFSLNCDPSIDLKQFIKEIYCDGDPAVASLIAECVPHAVFHLCLQRAQRNAAKCPKRPHDSSDP